MLIKCPECNKEISDKAETCPHCGIRLKEPPKQESSLVSKKAALIINRNHKWGNIIGIISGIVLIIMSIVAFIVSATIDYAYETGSLITIGVFSLISGVFSIIIGVYRLNNY